MNNPSDKPGVVNIHGLEYQTVALRVTNFREEHPEWEIKTKLIDAGLHVIMRTSIKNEDGKLIATGHAEEERGTGVNATSALENCETSAVGRALAFYKYPGQFLRSADEMSDALIQQGIKKVQKDFGERMAVLRNPVMLQKIIDLKDRLADNDYHAAVEIINEFKEDEVDALNLAPTKGGILTTAEVNQLKSNEYTAARNSISGYKPTTD